MPGTQEKAQKILNEKKIGGAGGGQRLCFKVIFSRIPLGNWYYNTSKIRFLLTVVRCKH